MRRTSCVISDSRVRRELRADRVIAHRACHRRKHRGSWAGFRERYRDQSEKVEKCNGTNMQPAATSSNNYAHVLSPFAPRSPSLFYRLLSLSLFAFVTTRCYYASQISVYAPRASCGYIGLSDER